MDESAPHEDCARVLAELIDALRLQAPRLNARLPYPDRMAITEIEAADIQAGRTRECTTMLSVHAGGAPKSYRLDLTFERGVFRLTISDEADFDERLTLRTSAGQAPRDEDVHAFFDALATDIAGHFGTDS